MEPVIVATKIANKRHEFGVIPSGVGIKRTDRPATSTMTHLSSLLLICVWASETGCEESAVLPPDGEGTSSFKLRLPPEVRAAAKTSGILVCCNHLLKLLNFLASAS